MQIPATIALAFATLALTPGFAREQCAFSDNLENGNCCTPLDIDLPPLPAVNLQSQGICWSGCNVSAQTCVFVSIAPPVAGPTCSEFVVPMEVADCSGNLLLQGDATLNYTRNWTEEIVAGSELGVWRMAFKADLAVPAGTPPTCPIPSCIGPQPEAFFYGYVDYALDCVTNTWSHSLAMYHACDEFIHQPLLSSRPGTYHPNESWAIVGPDTASNPFSPGFAPPPPQATPMGAGVRTLDSGFPFVCAAEEPIFGGEFFNFASICACPLSFTLPPQQTASRFRGQAVCGSRFDAINAWPTVPWFEMMTTSLGRWSSVTEYPGPEHASVSEVPVLYRDACSTPSFAGTIELFYGGMTQFGFQITSFTPGSFQTLLDLASNYSNPFPGPLSFPLFGQVQATDHLIYTHLFF